MQYKEREEKGLHQETESKGERNKEELGRDSMTLEHRLPRKEVKKCRDYFNFN